VRPFQAIGVRSGQAGLYIDSNSQGVLVADVKNLRVPHPIQPNVDIVYACIEGPEAAVYVRGTAHLVNGEATISLPDHFMNVANPESMTVQVTPLSGDSRGLAIVGKQLGRIDVKELYHGTGNYDFDWEVKCVRKGYEDYRATRPHDDIGMPRPPQ
jgi:hypothetical protein